MTENTPCDPQSVQSEAAGEPEIQESGGPVEDEVVSAERDAGSDSQPQRPASESGKSDRKADASLRFVDVVSGEFDAQEAADMGAPTKRVLAPQIETPKLHKVLAQAGMGSRLEMEQLIMEGRISVNNEPAHIGQRIQFGDQIKVNGKPIRFRIDPPAPRVIAYHKPAGEVVTHDDPQNRPTVFRKLPKLHQGKWQSVGRLDLNTEGLLLFTSSGELANKLMHPRFGLEREYAVRVLGALTKEEKQRLLEGVRLDDGIAQFGSIEEGGGEGSNCWYRVTISEGRNREVRRMLEAVGHAVSRLIRIRYGAMVLPRGLKRGAWMELDEGDIRALMQAVDKRGVPGRAEGAESGEGAGRSESGKPGNGGRKRQRGGGPRGNGNVPRNPASSQNARSGQGQGRKEGGNRQGGQGGDSQPDPMKTAFGYIGADSFTRQRQGGARQGGGSGTGGPRRGGRGR
jgi:23S rRNA pseudouridine2605 synthase